KIALLTAVAREHDARVDVDAVDVASLQPLADEILDECFGAVVLEHSLDLPGEVLAQLVTLGEAEQLVVGHGRPKEVRKARRQGVFIYKGINVGRSRWLAFFYAKEKSRRSKDRHDGLGDAILEALAGLVVTGLRDFQQ